MKQELTNSIKKDIFEVPATILKFLKIIVKQELEKNNYHITSEEYHIFILIGFKKVKSVSDICNILKLKGGVSFHKSNVSRSIHGLIEKGYVEVYPDVDDRRKKLLRIKDEKAFLVIEKVVSDLINELISDIGQENLELFLDIGSKIKNKLTDYSS